ncbi:MAG: acyl-CoA thioesterase [Pseudomonadales bacterium]|nr:acyl-CoA thioesterase [Pseudomonadales bacterium]
MFRFMLLIFVLRVRPTKDMYTPVDRQFRVKPWDLDLNIHLNNAKYLKYLDKGRIEHILRSRPVRKLMSRQYKLIVANTEISYIRSLLPFQKITVSSRVTGWDHKYVYYEQTFTSHGQLYATAIVRLALRKGEKGASPLEVLDQLFQIKESPELPHSVVLLNRLIKAQRIESNQAAQANSAATRQEESTEKSKPVKELISNDQ